MRPSIRTCVIRTGILAACLLGGPPAMAGDTDASPAGKAPAKPGAKPAADSPADARAAPRALQQVRARIEQRIGGHLTSVRWMPFGLYEVVADNEVFYVDPDVNYLVAGRVIDVKTHDDLTAARRDEVLRVDFKSLPLDQAVKTVRGNGSRVFVVFADPNCPYCKKLERDLAGLNDTTMYTFLYPILSQDSVDKSIAIWCSADRAAAWNSAMVGGKAPKLDGEACKNPIDDNLALGRKLAVTATPTLVFSDGRRLPGAVPIDRVESLLAAAAGNAAPAN
ncbi:MAG TPA: DsbC family protein [Burkholderiaceae bacterium]|nr:DsbC family protein [Burkholderiaceae bacterium]